MTSAEQLAGLDLPALQEYFVQKVPGAGRLTAQLIQEAGPI